MLHRLACLARVAMCAVVQRRAEQKQLPSQTKQRIGQLLAPTQQPPHRPEPVGLAATARAAALSFRRRSLQALGGAAVIPIPDSTFQNARDQNR